MSDKQTEREEIGGPEFKRRLWEAMQDEQADRDILPRLKPLPRKMVVWSTAHTKEVDWSKILNK